LQKRIQPELDKAEFGHIGALVSEMVVTYTYGRLCVFCERIVIELLFLFYTALSHFIFR